MLRVKQSNKSDIVSEPVNTQNPENSIAASEVEIKKENNDCPLKHINTDAKVDRDENSKKHWIWLIIGSVVVICIASVFINLYMNRNQTPEEKYNYAKAIIQTDSDNGLKFLKESADSGYSKACLEYGQIKLQGILCSPDTTLAVEYIKKAYELNQDIEAARFLFNYYAKEESDSVYPYAYKLYEFGINDSTTIHYVAYGYAESKSIGDLKEMLKKENNITSDIYYCLGYCYQDNEQYNNAFYYFTLASDRGHSRAKVYLGWMYYHGYLGRTDYNKAFRYFNDAIRKDPIDRAANYYLGTMYYYGYGCNVNVSKAKTYLEIAVKHGNEKAGDLLGKIFITVR